MRTVINVSSEAMISKGEGDGVPLGKGDVRALDEMMEGPGVCAIRALCGAAAPDGKGGCGSEDEFAECGVDHVAFAGRPKNWTTNMVSLFWYTA